SHRLEKLKISITKNFQTELPNIRGNKNQLEQVMLNLLINSLDSIEEKYISDPACEKRIILNAARKDNYVILYIQDTGKGIPENIKDKIFDPFFTTKQPGKGTGLGLSVVYKIIESHNGKIQIDSNEGIGTTVKISIPVYK
uniref:sensor histidine kinase n=1 Tax=Ignavibacterium sp. TaxID=2651167 RepID=UPI0025C51997